MGKRFSQIFRKEDKKKKSGQEIKCKEIEHRWSSGKFK